MVQQLAHYKTSTSLFLSFFLFLFAFSCFSSFLHHALNYIGTTQPMAIRENPIFKTKESILTISVVTFEAILICILEGIVIMNHLGLVSNCNPDSAGVGLWDWMRLVISLYTHVNFILGVSESDLIYHSLFIIAQVFQVVLCADALYQRNTGNVLFAHLSPFSLYWYFLQSNLAQLCALITFGLLVVGKFLLKLTKKVDQAY